MDSHAVDAERLRRPPQPRRVADGPRPTSPRPRLASRLIKIAGRIAINLVVLAMTAVALLMLVPAVLGFHRYVILTGSMTGTYDRGSVVFDRPVPVSELKVGDPITYSPPPGFTQQQRVTHRIWWTARGPHGERSFRTKGDANHHPDAWKFTLSQPTQDRVVFHVPYIGYPLMLLSIRNFRLVLVSVPALLSNT